MNDRTIQEARGEGFGIDPCDTCEYNSLDWHEEPCESCTGADNHWKPPTQSNTSKALEALDCISRAAAIDAIQAEADEAKEVWSEFDDESAFGQMNAHSRDIDIIKRLPSAQPYALDEWCTDCKEYDHEKHCCSRYNRVIRDAMSEAQPKIIRCKDCKFCVDLNHDGDYSCLTAYGYRHIDRLDWYCADAERRGGQDE